MTYHNRNDSLIVRSIVRSITHDSCSIQLFMQENYRNSWHLNCTNLHYYALPSSIIFVVISERLVVQFFLFMIIRLIWVSGHDLVPPTMTANVTLISKKIVIGRVHSFSPSFFDDCSVTRSQLYTGLGINSSAGVHASTRVHTLVDKKLRRVLIVLQQYSSTLKNFKL